MQNLSQVWDLERIFAGGSGSAEFQTMLKTAQQELANLETSVRQAKELSTDYWIITLSKLQTLIDKQDEMSAFTACLEAQDVQDRQARILNAKVLQLAARVENLLTLLEAQMVAVKDSQWQELLKLDKLQPIAFWLDNRRKQAREKLSPEQETLATNLGIDGYHAWGYLYDTIVGQIEIPLTEGDKQQLISVGQAANMLDDANREVRKAVFAKYEAAWEQNSQLCAGALNHLAGFRNQLYQERGWDNPLHEALAMNRMTQQTLDTMWQVVSQSKEKVTEYLKRKAELLGLERLAWYDLEAPLNQDAPKTPYLEAASFIVDRFAKFSPDLGELAKRALENGWIESEDRPKKQPGGFCTSFPLTKETRIFMTYSGTPGGVSTIAHELGHAYHAEVLKDLPALARDYPMNLAETASTLGELIVSDAAIKQATSKQERIGLLEGKIQNVVAFFMNIHARFLFETRFYEQRKQGLVSVDTLNQLMLDAQQEAYGNTLDEYHPYFWASKLHFYLTFVPFYNFPYTFGYLFSNGVYAKALSEGPGFADRYRELLEDTGRMTVEQLAKKHLQADLTKPEFWQAAVGLVLADIDEFLELTN